MIQGNKAFEGYVARLKAKHGDKFSTIGIAPDFAPHYGSRVEVMTPWGEKMRGWVGGTTGWHPSLMLLAKSNSTGSSELISKDYKLLSVLKTSR